MNLAKKGDIFYLKDNKDYEFISLDDEKKDFPTRCRITWCEGGELKNNIVHIYINNHSIFEKNPLNPNKNSMSVNYFVEGQVLYSEDEEHIVDKIENDGLILMNTESGVLKKLTYDIVTSFFCSRIVYQKNIIIRNVISYLIYLCSKTNSLNKNYFEFIASLDNLKKKNGL